MLQPLGSINLYWGVSYFAGTPFLFEIYWILDYPTQYLPDRLMVGRWFLVPKIGVRVPVGQQQN